MTLDSGSTESAIRMWQRIPLDERQSVVASAHARALGCCLTLMALGATAAWSLSMPTLVLATGVITPIVFQAIFTRSWAREKPRAIAEYMAAEHTARHFATILKAPHTRVDYLFRATAERAHDRSSDSDDSQESNASGSPKIPVWVSLFPQSLLMVTEGAHGAKLVFAHSTIDRFRSSMPQAKEEGELPSALIVETEDLKGTAAQWILSSPHPRTLEVCHERIQMLTEQAHARSFTPSQSLEIR